MNINRCELSGNVTRDGELKATRGGTAVLTFGLAFNDRKRSAAGEWENVPNFIDCVMYGKLAESLAQYVMKGQKLFVAGRLHYSSWDSNGQKRSKLELVVDTIDLASGRTQREQSAARQAPAYSTPPAPEPVQDLQDDLYDEEIPF